MLVITSDRTWQWQEPWACWTQLPLLKQKKKREIVANLQGCHLASATAWEVARQSLRGLSLFLSPLLASLFLWKLPFFASLVHIEENIAAPRVPDEFLSRIAPSLCWRQPWLTGCVFQVGCKVLGKEKVNALALGLANALGPASHGPGYHPFIPRATSIDGKWRNREVGSVSWEIAVHCTLTRHQPKDII